MQYQQNVHQPWSSRGPVPTEGPLTLVPNAGVSFGGVHSRDNEYAHFFGEPSRLGPTSMEQRTHYDAFEQFDNTNVKSLCQFVIHEMTERDVFWMQQILPWADGGDKDTINWDTWIFNDAMLDLRPDESVSRLLTSSRSSETAHMQTYGRALEMEYNFHKTPQGQLHFAMQVKTLINATLETAAFGAAMALYTAPPPRTRKGVNTVPHWDVVSYMKLLDRECELWNCLAKNKDGYKWSVDLLKQAMDSYGTSPNTLILPDGAGKYIATQQSRQPYAVTGRKQPLYLNEATDFPGMTVFSSRAFRRGEGMPRVDPAFAERTIGGFFTALYRDTADVPKEEYRTSMRDVFAFSEDLDREFRHSFQEMVSASGLVRDDGGLTDWGAQFFQTNWDAREGKRTARDGGGHDFGNEMKEGLHMRGMLHSKTPATSHGGFETWKQFLDYHGLTERVAYALSFVKGKPDDVLKSGADAPAKETEKKGAPSGSGGHSGANAPWDRMLKTKPQLKAAIVEISAWPKLTATKGNGAFGTSAVNNVASLVTLLKRLVDAKAVEVNTSLLTKAARPAHVSKSNVYWMVDPDMLKSGGWETVDNWTDGGKAESSFPAAVAAAIGSSGGAPLVSDSVTGVLYLLHCELGDEKFQIEDEGVDKLRQRVKDVHRLLSGQGAMHSAGSHAPHGMHSAGSHAPHGMHTSGHSWRGEVTKEGMDIAAAIIGARIHPASMFLKHCFDTHAPIPLSLICWTPHERFVTGTMLACKRGSELGNTFIGQQNAQLGRDTNRKMLHVHYTCKLKSLIVNSNMLASAANVLVKDYRGGAGHRYWHATNDEHRQAYRSGQLDGRDIFVTAVPWNYRQDEITMDITGKFNPLYVDDPLQLHYPTAGVYKQWWGWQHGRTVPHLEHETKDHARLNTVCRQRYQRVFHYSGSVSSSDFTNITVSKGHNGENVYPGCAKTRNGMAMYYKTINYDQTSSTALV